MTWSVQIPHRDRSDSLASVGELARHLPADQRDVTRQIIVGAMFDGLSTAGDLIDRLGTASPEQRRNILDAARQRADLPTTRALDATAAHQARSRALAEMPDRTAPPVCAHPTCISVPVNATGMPTVVDVVRWWCPEHVDQASPGDLAPAASGLHWGPNGIVDEREQAADRAAAEAEAKRLRLRREQRRAERAADLPDLERDHAGRADHYQPANARGPR